MRSDFSGQRLACPHCHANNFVGQMQCWQCKGSLPPPEATRSVTPNTPAASTPPAWAQQPNAQRPNSLTPNAQYPMPGPQYPASNAQCPTPNASVAPNALTPPQSTVSRSLLPLFLCVTLLTASGVLWWATHRMPVEGVAGSPGTAFPGESAGMRDLRRDARGVVPEREMPNSGLADPGSAPRPGMGRNSLPTSGDPTEMAAKKAVEHALPKLGIPPAGGSSDGRVHLRNGDSISQEQYDEVQRKLKSNPLFGSGAPVPRL